MAKYRKNDPINKLKNVSGSYKWTELVSLLRKLGYTKTERQGSRVAFHHHEKGCVIILHKPHPENTVDKGAQQDVIDHLAANGFLK